MNLMNLKLARARFARDCERVLSWLISGDARVKTMFRSSKKRECDLFSFLATGSSNYRRQSLWAEGVALLDGGVSQGRGGFTADAVRALPNFPIKVGIPFQSRRLDPHKSS
jgi:hypothetical protein